MCRICPFFTGRNTVRPFGVHIRRLEALEQGLKLNGVLAGVLYLPVTFDLMHGRRNCPDSFLYCLGRHFADFISAICI
jgi:hypothetical protein